MPEFSTKMSQQCNLWGSSSWFPPYTDQILRQNKGSTCWMCCIAVCNIPSSEIPYIKETFNSKPFLAHLLTLIHNFCYLVYFCMLYHTDSSEKWGWQRKFLWVKEKLQLCSSCFPPRNSGSQIPRKWGSWCEGWLLGSSLSGKGSSDPKEQSLPRNTQESRARRARPIPVSVPQPSLAGCWCWAPQVTGFAFPAARSRRHLNAAHSSCTLSTT